MTVKNREFEGLHHTVKTLFFILAIFSVPEGTYEKTAGHPQDGPDVDLRIRIEASRIELQAIVNLVFCDEVIGQTRLFEDALAPKEVPTLSESLIEKFDDHVTLKVDGLKTTPLAKTCVLLPYVESDAEFFPNMGLRAVIKLKVTFEYALKMAPRTVALHWGMFPTNLAIEDFVDESIQINAEWTAGSDSKIVSFTEAEPEYIWHGKKGGLTPHFLNAPRTKQTQEKSRWWFYMIPWGLWVFAGFLAHFRGHPLSLRHHIVFLVVVILASLTIWQAQGDAHTRPPTLQDADAIEVFHVLHANVYRAFDFTEEEEIYDALSRSVEGELLAEIYDQIYASLIMQDQGGAVSRVKKVIPMTSHLENSDHVKSGEFTVLARWRVLGQVYHWGHTHMRTNEHLARMKVRWNGEAWHIAASKVVEQFRVEANTNEGNR